MQYQCQPDSALTKEINDQIVIVQVYFETVFLTIL